MYEDSYWSETSLFTRTAISSPVWPRASKLTTRKSTPLKWAHWSVPTTTSTTHRSDHFAHVVRSIHQEAGFPLRRRRGRLCAAWPRTFPPGRRPALTTTPSGRTTGTWTMKVCICVCLCAFMSMIYNSFAWRFLQVHRLYSFCSSLPLLTSNSPGRNNFHIAR